MVKYLAKIGSLYLSLPAILAFLTSKDIGSDYGVGFGAKLKLLIRFCWNRRKVETLSDFREHMELAAAILRIPRDLEGKVVECGCYMGGSTINLSLVCKLTGRELLVFDSFEGLPEPQEYDRWHHAVHVQHTDIYYKGRFAASQEAVERNIAKFGSLGICEFRAGYYEETMRDIEDSVALAFLDVDLIDSLKPCLKGLWPKLGDDCRIYVHEALNLALVSVFFDQEWWRENLCQDAPGFVGSGVGLPLGIGKKHGSELGYAQNTIDTGKMAPDRDPELLRKALNESEMASFLKLNNAGSAGA